MLNSCKKSIGSKPSRLPTDDLKNAKDYLVGNFPNQIETPDQIAGRVTQYMLLGLGQEELETYRDKLAAVEIEDISRVMGEYLHPGPLNIVLVGDALEIYDKVSA